MAEENSLRYNDVAEGIDLQYTAFGEYTKEDIILMEPTELKRFEYEIDTENPEGKSLEYRIEDNVLNI